MMTYRQPRLCVASVFGRARGRCGKRESRREYPGTKRWGDTLGAREHVTSSTVNLNQVDTISGKHLGAPIREGI